MSTPAAYAAVLALTLLALSLAQSLLAPKRGKKRAVARGDAVLLLGPCGAGKTALFYALRGKPVPDTVSSLAVNSGSLDVAGAPRPLTDFPGHQRLKAKAMQEVKAARCVVYLIDSTEKQQIRDAAEQLYDLLTYQELIDRRTPILVCASKRDLPTSRKETQVEDELTREIERMRKSRLQTLDGEDAADHFLGVEGEAFRFAHAPVRVDFAAVSVPKDLAPIRDFLAQAFE